jgi:hypothetical protein
MYYIRVLIKNPNHPVFTRTFYCIIKYNLIVFGYAGDI